MKIGELAKTVKDVSKDITILRSSVSADNGIIRLLWGDRGNDSLPPSLFPVQAKQRVRPIQLRIVIIGPDNKEEHYYGDVIELPDGLTNQKFMIVRYSLNWADDWERQ